MPYCRTYFLGRAALLHQLDVGYGMVLSFYDMLRDSYFGQHLEEWHANLLHWRRTEPQHLDAARSNWHLLVLQCNNYLSLAGDQMCLGHLALPERRSQEVRRPEFHILETYAKLSFVLHQNSICNAQSVVFHSCTCT